MKEDPDPESARSHLSEETIKENYSSLRVGIDRQHQHISFFWQTEISLEEFMQLALQFCRSGEEPRVVHVDSSAQATTPEEADVTIIRTAAGDFYYGLTGNVNVMAIRTGQDIFEKAAELITRTSALKISPEKLQAGLSRALQKAKEPGK